MCQYVVEHHKNINNEILFCTSTKDTTTPIEEGAEKCHVCKSKRSISIDVQKRSTNEGMTTMFECSVCRNKRKL